MTTLTLKYINRYKDRHGRVRHYYRRPGYERSPLPGEPGSAEFMAAYQAAHAATRDKGEERTKPGTVDELIVGFYKSNAWNELDALTHKTYRSILDRFRKAYGHLPAKGLKVRHAAQIVDKGKDTPGATRNLIKRLRTVWKWGLKRELVTENPWTIVDLPKEGAGFRAWTDDDIAKFEQRWPVGSKERLALALLLYTLVRRSDVVLLGPQHRKTIMLVVDGEAKPVDVMRLTQTKGSRKKGEDAVELVIPLHPELKTVLDATPVENLTYLMTEWGKPFSGDGFTDWFGERAQMAGLPAGSTPHGLRKAGSRRLAEAGCTPHEIQGVSGHRTLAEVERYTRSVRQTDLAVRAIAKLEGGAKPANPVRVKRTRNAPRTKQ